MRAKLFLFVKAFALFGLISSAHATTYVFKTFDFPSVTDQTSFQGINNAGTIVGWYHNNGVYGAFVYSNGTYTAFDSSIKYALGINNNSQIVGYGNSFINYVDTGGTITHLAYPGSNETYTNAINDAGQIVGGYTIGSSSNLNGFLYSGGAYTSLSPPVAGAYDLTARGINSNGDIVGDYQDGITGRGFLYSNGKYTTLGAGSSATFATGINDLGQIVGFDAGGEGYVYAHGVYDFFGVPGSSYTEAFGINDLGQIVGNYNDRTGTHAFLASPTPLPAALPLFAGGLVTIGLFGWRRKQKG
jgi:probable HAF family extracellular repeat protein